MEVRVAGMGWISKEDKANYRDEDIPVIEHFLDDRLRVLLKSAENVVVSRPELVVEFAKVRVRVELECGVTEAELGRRGLPGVYHPAGALMKIYYLFGRTLRELRQVMGEVQRAKLPDELTRKTDAALTHCAERLASVKDELQPRKLGIQATPGYGKATLDIDERLARILENLDDLIEGFDVAGLVLPQELYSSTLDDLDDSLRRIEAVRKDFHPANFPIRASLPQSELERAANQITLARWRDEIENYEGKVDDMLALARAWGITKIDYFDIESFKRELRRARE